MHIVVLAYGPSQQTKRAVNRARMLVGGGKSLNVVAASEFARSSTGIRADNKVGRAGLVEILEQLGNEPTMLIHDDVVITTRGIMALERSLEQGNRLVVPYTNDPSTDHFMGSLPIGRSAEKELDRISVPQASKPATEVRPSCVAGRSNDLIHLLAESLADPYALINAAKYNFTVSAGAAAAHSSLCLQSLVEEDLDERPLLVAALIVKDEEKMLPECLESLARICDRIEVCDTGSTDRTIAVARAAGANVIERNWPDSFGEARNYVLEQCRDARYTLVLDADERVTCANPELTRRYLATYSTEHEAFSVDVDNLTSDGNEMYSIISVRIFHSTETEYRGALHEVVYKTDESDAMSGNHLSQIKVAHYGYSPQVIAERKKSSRNLELAEAQYQTSGDARTAIHLARSLSFAGETPERALALLTQSLEEVGDGPAVTRGQILSLMADQCNLLGQHQKSFDLAVRALELLPGDDTAAALASATALTLGDYESLIAIADKISNANSHREMVRVDHNRMIYRNNLVTAYAHTGRSEDAVTEAFAILTESPAEFHAWSPLIDCLDAAYGPAAVELLAPLAAKDSTGGFLEPIISTYSTEATARFCALYCSLGGAIPEAIRVGLLAAVMSNNDRAFVSLLRAAANLDPELKDELADRISTHGRPDLATKLRNGIAATPASSQNSPVPW